MRIQLSDNDIDTIVECVMRSEDGNKVVDCMIEDVLFYIRYTKSEKILKDDDYFNGTGSIRTVDVDIHIESITCEIGIEVDYDSTYMESNIRSSILAS